MNSINPPLGIAGRARRGGTVDVDALAAQTLGYLAADEERLLRFLSLTGFDPARLRAEAGTDAFNRAILSYLAADEELLVGLAQHMQMPPAELDLMLRRELERPRPPGR